MEHSSVAYVILGNLDDKPLSGYDIKARVDSSTRFFWAASYGQIYPELKRLVEAGLIEPAGEPSGGRRRTVYRITPAGRQALRDWLASPPQTHELRDEGLLKVFFADALAPAHRVELLRAVRSRHETVLERLRRVEPFARERGGYPYEVLKRGLAIHASAVEWCSDLERRETEA